MRPSDIFKEILDLQICAAIAPPERKLEIQALLQSRKAQLIRTSKCSTEDIQQGIKREYRTHAGTIIDRVLGS